MCAHVHSFAQLLFNISRLQTLVDGLVSKFVSANLMHQQYERVKLHITVLNTLFRKDPDGVSASPTHNLRGPPRDRESFNASSLLQVSMWGCLLVGWLGA